MKKYLLLALLLVVPNLAMAQAGYGYSTVTCVDKDGDGYGTGPGCTAQDADDNDVGVHTAAQGIAKYGTIVAFLQHLGYNATGNIRYIATTGTDSGTCTLISPCATFAYVRDTVGIAADDVVFWRAGTYSEGIPSNYDTTLNGTNGHPIVFMAYPGEAVIFDNATSSRIGLCRTNTASDITIDGFVLKNTATQAGHNIDGCYWTRITVQHVDSSQTVDGIFAMQALTDVTVRYNVSHDTFGQGHGIYLGARDLPGSNVTIFGNIVYNCDSSGIQFNGRVTNLQMDNNVSYNNAGGSGLTFTMGVSNSFARNNLAFGNAGAAFIIQNYDASHGSDPSNCDVSGICPYDQKNNVIENNTFIGDATNHAGLEVTNTTTTGIGDLGHNTYRNNIILATGNYGRNPAVLFPDDNGSSPYTPQNFPYLLTSTLDHNFLWNYDGTQAVPSQGVIAKSVLRSGSGGVGYSSMTVATAQSTYFGVITNSTNANPLFATFDGVCSPASNCNFHPQTSSTIISAGSTTGVPTTDLNGIARGPSPSLGAYQFPSATGTAIPTNTWVFVQTRGVPAQAVGWEKLAYDTLYNKAYFLGDYHEYGSEPNIGLLSYDFVTNRWDVLDTTGLFYTEFMPEGGHEVGGLAWNSSTHQIQYNCCASGANQPQNPWHYWSYDPIGQAGRDILVSPRPNNTQYPTAVYDSTNSKYDLYIPLNINAGVVNQTATYDASTGQWTSETTSGTIPNGLAFGSTTFNSSNGKVYFFGGVAGSYSNDVYTYDQSTKVWAKLTPSGTKPSGRVYAGWAYDSADNIILMFGGLNAGGVLFDTWKFDPSGSGTWTQLSPSTPPPNGTTSLGNAPFERMVYDPTHNVFILVLVGTSGSYVDGTWNTYSTQTWLYRYAGTGPNVGTSIASYSPTAGSLNRYATGLANEPVLAVNGSTLYMGWIETGAMWDTTNPWTRPYVSSYVSGSGWTQLGTYASIESNTVYEAHNPSLAIVNNVPWVSFYSADPTGFSGTLNLNAKQWNGSAWTGGAIGRVNASGYAWRSKLVGVSTTPYIAFLENNRLSAAAQQSLVYIKHYNGSSWATDGTFLNRGSTTCDLSTTNCSQASSVDAATDGTNLYVAWTEYETDGNTLTTVPQVYVSKWDGASVTTLGTSLNVSAAAYAFDAAITIVGSQPYVCWTERAVGGVAKAYCRTYTGGAWSSILGGGSLNKDGATGWAWRPSMTNDGTNVFVGWIEQQAIGQKAQGYVSKWNGSAWSALGSSLNMDTTNGSAQRMTLEMFGGQPVATFAETKYGSLRNVYGRSWTGATWVTLPAFRLDVTTAGTGSGTTTGAGIYNNGDTATVTQSAATGSVFAGWSGDCTGTGSCTVLMDGNKSVTATFNLFVPSAIQLGGVTIGGTQVH